MGRRRLGRETAFKALYSIDVTGKGLEEAISSIDPTGEGDPEAVRFAQELLETVGAHRERLDETLDRAADRWETSRMAAVDRSLLRLGAAEILYWRWIPEEVSIDEYVELAKKFGSEEAASFVNAVLDRIARDERTAGADS